MTNIDTIQKGVAVDPNSLSSAAGQESAMLIASLRDVIRSQASEIEKLQTQLKGLSAASGEVHSHFPRGLRHMNMNA